MSAAAEFLDTSALLYLVSGDAHKASRIEQLLRRAPVVSVQILNEFAAVALRKFSMSMDETSASLDLVTTTCRVNPVTLEDHELARLIATRYRFSFHDSVMVAAALRADCKTLYAEDLQHGQLIHRTLRVVNPFR
jgi:predicted nucleic acid-binding protein